MLTRYFENPYNTWNGYGSDPHTLNRGDMYWISVVLNDVYIRLKDPNSLLIFTIHNGNGAYAAWPYGSSTIILYPPFWQKLSTNWRRRTTVFHELTHKETLAIVNDFGYINGYATIEPFAWDMGKMRSKIDFFGGTYLHTVSTDQRLRNADSYAGFLADYYIGEK
jgi:hypothetical protein